MTPLEWLGLPADADERAVKRAYAQRLRDTRPDDDPAGFQELHAIYQAALEQCRQPSSAGASVKAPVAPPADSLPVDPPPDVTDVACFDFDAFADAALELAAEGNAEHLQTWLDGLPALWSLPLKQQAGNLLLQRIERECAPMPATCFTALLRCFGADDALAGYDPLAVRSLQQRLNLARELQPAHRDALARRLDLVTPDQRRVMEFWLRQLHRPANRWQQVCFGLMPERADGMTKFMAKLTQEHEQDLPASIDRRQVEFWLQATDHTRIRGPRLLIGGVRCLVILACAVLAGLLLGIVGRTPPESISTVIFLSIVGIGALPGVVWLIGLGLGVLDRWQVAPEYQAVHWPWLNLLLVPMLIAGALIIRRQPDNQLWTWILLFAAALLALRRCFRRGSIRLSATVTRGLWFAVWIGLVSLRTIFEDYLSQPGIVATLAGTALLFWAIDLWSHRHHLRVWQRG